MSSHNSSLVLVVAAAGLLFSVVNGQTFTCTCDVFDTTCDCKNAIFTCLSSNPSCTLQCDGIWSCEGVTLNCADGTLCNVDAESNSAGYNTLVDALINGEDASMLTISTMDSFLQGGNVVNCPSDGLCRIVNDQSQGDAKTENMVINANSGSPNIELIDLDSTDSLDPFGFKSVTINAQGANSLDFIADGSTGGYLTLQNVDIYCPQDGSNTGNCKIDIGSNAQDINPSTYTSGLATIYAIDGFDDIRLTGNNLNGLVIACGNSFENSCTIDYVTVDDIEQIVCLPSNSGCGDPSVPPPTSSPINAGNTPVSPPTPSPTAYNLLCEYSVDWNEFSGDWSYDSDTCVLYSETRGKDYFSWFGSSDGTTPDSNYLFPMYILSTNMKITGGNGAAGIIFGVQNLDGNPTYFYYGFKVNTNVINLQYRNQGVINTLFQYSTPLDYDQIYQLKIESFGNGYFNFYLDDTLIFDFIELTEYQLKQNQGSVGVRTSWADAQFESFELYEADKACFCN